MSIEEKKRPLLFQYFNSTADILLAEYKRTVVQEASDNLGANREFLCNNFLSKVLPIKLALASGVIWDSKNNKTGQLDTIISNEAGSQLQSNSNNHNYLLINGKAAPLAILYLYLVTYSCSFLGRSLNISEYFEPFNQWNILKD